MDLINLLSQPLPNIYDCKELNEYRDKEQENIKVILSSFVQKNTTNDFVVIGSACGILTSSYILQDVKDVDILIPDSLKSIKKVDKIDTLTRNFLPEDYKNRLIEVDGFKCLSKIDLIVNFVLALGQNKIKDRYYLDTLVYNEDILEIINLLEQAFKYHTRAGEFNDKGLKMIRNGINVFVTTYHSERISNLRNYFLETVPNYIELNK